MNSFSRQCYLGLDQGSSATKALIVDSNGQILFLERIPVGHTDHGDGRVEQDLNEVVESLRIVARKAVDFARKKDITLKSAGLALQRSGTCAWDTEGKPISPLLSWRDIRERKRVEALSGHYPHITERTGLPVNAHYAASKLAWLHEQYDAPGIYIGLLDSFLRFSFGAEPRWGIEETMAARTLLYSLQSGRWDEKLCEYFGIVPSSLAPVVPTFSRHGVIEGIPIAACIGDQQGALYGRSESASEVVLNLGTIGSLCLPVSSLNEQTPPGFIKSVLSSEEYQGNLVRRYLIEGISNSCGPILSRADLSEQGIQEESANSLPLPPLERVGYFPLGGTASPDWRMGLPNVIEGGQGDLTPEKVALSMRYHLAFSLAFLVEQLRETRQHMRDRMQVSGGYARNRSFLRTFANLVQMTLVVSEDSEATALGAAWLGAKGSGASFPIVLSGVEEIHYQGVPEVIDHFSRWKKLRKRVVSGSILKSDTIVEA